MKDLWCNFRLCRKDQTVRGLLAASASLSRCAPCLPVQMRCRLLSWLICPFPSWLWPPFLGCGAAGGTGRGRACCRGARFGQSVGRRRTEQLRLPAAPRLLLPEGLGAAPPICWGPANSVRGLSHHVNQG